MTVAIVDYDAGNLRSVETALARLQVDYRVVRRGEELREADRLVLPGVGDAGSAMATLRESGLADAIMHFFATGRPILGICLGSQIVLDRSEESDARCLGLIPGSVVALPRDAGYKIPHMGWNTIEPLVDHPLFRGIEEDSSFYFVHSYVPKPEQGESILAECEYGVRFAAVVGRENLVAAQFHPEKSGVAGLRMLDNFLQWMP
ncbi:MAG: imidazole glycerol phosphate synthase subunit HisH [Spirochaetaceae bacterium]|nr:MAG: imidazole glycerol phosphate synthase subunit HisH [Spirochaetaceae bacterium]